MSLPHPEDAPEFWAHVPEKRLVAWLIDLVVTLLLVLLLALPTAGVALFFLPLTWSAVAIAMRWVMLSRYGATLGMLMVSLRLRHLDGRVPDPTVCLWHAVLHSASMLFVLPQVASVAMILGTTRRQSLGDWILQTTMINRPQA